MSAPEQHAPLEPSDLESLIASVVDKTETERKAAIERFCRDRPDEDPDALCDAVAGAARKRDAARSSFDADRHLAQLKAISSPPGRYELQGEVARGGMGVILRVQDLALGRPLAMKVILGQAEASSGTTPTVDGQALARFLGEAHVTGQLDHPGVVPVHELGLDASGRVYFTMRLVKGIDADEVFALARAGQEGWTLTRALEVVLKLCDTLAYAHEQGVIHRDLKPSNVMVGRFGEVYVMDWGLARVRGSPDRRDLRVLSQPQNVSLVHNGRSSQADPTPSSTFMTMDGTVIGTPSYMPPEQAAGRIEAMGTHSDVYALGAILYTLLTGRQPYVEPGVQRSPWTILNLVQHGPPRPVHALDPSIPAELVAICERAMMRQPENRYADMRALSDDLRAYLEKRVVKAYRTGAGAELAMWVRRNRALAAAMIAIVLALVGGITTATLYARRAARNAAVQKQQLVQASWAAFHQADRLFAQSDAADPTGAGGATVPAREALLHLSRAVAFDPSNRVAWERFSLETALRKGQWRLPNEVAAFVHDDLVLSATLSPDGTRVATSSADKTVRVWDALSARLLHTLMHDRVTAAAFSPDGRCLATAGRADKTAKLWDTASGALFHVLPHHSGVQSTAFSPDGTYVMTTTLLVAILWHVGTGKQVQVFPHGMMVRTATFSVDGRRVVTLSDDRMAKLWDPGTGKLVHTLAHDSVVDGAEFSPDGARVAVSAGTSVIVWDAGSGIVLYTLAHESAVRSMTFSPDGTRTLTASGNSAQLWDAGCAVPLRAFGHDGLTAATFSPDGTRVMTRGVRSVKLWDATTGTMINSFTLERSVASAMFTPEGTRVMVADDRSAMLLDSGNGRRSLSLTHDSRVGSATFNANGTHVVTTDGSCVKLWDARSGRLVHRLAHEGRVVSAMFDPDGTRVVSASLDRTARLWDAGNGMLLWTFAHEDPVRSAAFSPDGTRVATVTVGKTARLWSASDGTLIHTWGHEDQVVSAEFNPDGTRIMTASHDGTARVWDSIGGNVVHTFNHEDRVRTAVFSTDGDRILTASSDKTASLWDAISGKQLRRLTPGRVVRSATFSPDAAYVLAVTDAGAQLYHAASGAQRHVFTHSETVTSPRFSPDGMRVVTISGRSAMLWDTATGKRVCSFSHANPVWSATFNADGTRLMTASDASVKLWDLLLEEQSRPSDSDRVAQATALAECLTDQSLSLLSELTVLPQHRRDQLRAEWDTMLRISSPLRPLVRWLAAHGPDSHAYIGSSITCRERAGILIEQGSAIAAREALHIDPGHPLVQIALAAHGDVPAVLPAADRPTADAASITRRDFLRDYGLRRLPADVHVCARAAAMLLAQNDKPRALVAAKKALALDRTNAAAGRVVAEASH